MAGELILIVEDSVKSRRLARDVLQRGPVHEEIADFSCPRCCRRRLSQAGPVLAASGPQKDKVLDS